DFAVLFFQILRRRIALPAGLENRTDRIRARGDAQELVLFGPRSTRVRLRAWRRFGGIRRRSYRRGGEPRQDSGGGCFQEVAAVKRHGLYSRARMRRAQGTADRSRTGDWRSFVLVWT